MQQKEFIDLLKEAVSPYQCVEAAMRRLKENGFEELRYEDAWKLVPGRKYVMNHHDTTCYA